MANGNGFGFEVGSNGDAASTSNTGADAIGSPLSGTMTISTTQKAHDTRSLLLDTTTTSGVTYISKTIAGTDTITVRGYVRWNALPGGTITPSLVWFGAGTSQLVNLEVTAAGLLRIRDDASANAWTSTNAMTTGVWYRFEFSVTRNATTGTVRVAFYTLDSSTPVEDSGTITGKNTGASAITTIRIGIKCATGTMTANAHMDDWDYDPTTLTFMGAYVSTLTTPTVTLGLTKNPSAPGVNDGEQTVTYTLSPGASNYDAGISSSPTAAQGDITTVASNIGSSGTYKYTGLGQDLDGRTYAIRAKA